MKTQTSAARPLGRTGNVRHRSPGIDRWQLLELVVDLRKTLSLTDRDIAVLRAHMTVMPSGPLDPGRLNVSFMEVGEILNRACGMDERRFRRGEARLEEAGLIVRRLSANGRRFPQRNAQGVIVSAYGIDISPLLARIDELTELRIRHEEAARDLQRMRNDIGARMSSILNRGSLCPPALRERLEQTRGTMRRIMRRVCPCRQEIEAVNARLSDIEHELEAQKRDPSTGSLTDIEPVDDRQDVRRIESKPKEKEMTGISSQDPTSSAGQVAKLYTAWRSASHLREFYPEPPASEEHLARTIMEFSGFLGLGQRSILKALSAFGSAGCINAIDYMASRLDKIHRPDGYMASMITSYLSGQCVAGGRIVPPSHQNTPEAFESLQPHYRGNMARTA